MAELDGMGVVSHDLGASGGAVTLLLYCRVGNTKQGRERKEDA